MDIIVDFNKLEDAIINTAGETLDRTTQFGQFAKRYRDAGVVVLPAHRSVELDKGSGSYKPKKYPMIGKYAQYHREYPNDAFYQQQATVCANWCLLTGHGLFVLDIDGDAGRDDLAGLETQYGNLPETLKVATQGGGEHWYFRTEGVIKSTAKVIAPHLDIRGDGGLIMAAPSFYDFHDGHRTQYELIHEAPIAYAPQWLVDLANGNKTSANSVSIPSSSQGSHSPQQVIDLSSINVNGWYMMLSRGEQLHDSMLRIVGNAVAKNLDKETVRANVLQHLQLSGRDEKRIHEVAYKEFDRAWQSSVDKGFGVHDPVTQAMLSRSTALAEATLQAIEKAQSFDLMRYRSDQFYTGQPKPPQWLIKNVVELGAPCMLYSDGGVGKGFQALELAVAVAAGWKRCSWGSVQAQGVAVFITLEDGQRALHERLNALTDGKHTSESWGEKLIIVPAGEIVSLKLDTANPMWLRLCEQIKSLDPKLLVLDTLGRLSAGAEMNSASDMSAVVGAFADFASSMPNCTSIITHHTNKSGGGMASAMIVNSVRAVYRLDKLKHDGGWDNHFKAYEPKVIQVIEANHLDTYPGCFIALSIEKNNLGLEEGVKEIIFRPKTSEHQRFGKPMGMLYQNAAERSQDYEDYDMVLVSLQYWLTSQKNQRIPASRLKKEQCFVMEYYADRGCIDKEMSRNGGTSYLAHRSQELPAWLKAYERPKKELPDLFKGNFTAMAMAIKSSNEDYFESVA